MAREPESRPDSAGAAFALLNAGIDPPRPIDTPETFASWVSSGRLVGRESVLETLRLTLAGHAAAVPLARRPISTRGRAAASPGEALAPRVMMISGPPGSGKSRLVREFGQDLQLEGWRTLANALATRPAARCSRSPIFSRRPAPAGSMPAPLADVLDPGVRPPGARRARRARQGRDCGPASRRVSTTSPATAPVSSSSKTCNGPTRPGFDLLEHLLLREERPRWLVIGTLRDGAAAGGAAAGGAVGGRLARLQERSGLKHLALAPLDASQTTDLLVSMLPFAEPPRALAALLLEKTGGAALHIEEILKGLFAAGLLAAPRRDLDLSDRSRRRPAAAGLSRRSRPAADRHPAGRAGARGAHAGGPARPVPMALLAAPSRAAALRLDRRQDAARGRSRWRRCIS